MLSQVLLKQYRNIADLELEISNGANILIAPNGFGKTNFLESIFLQALGISFKPNVGVKDVIKEGEDFARIETHWSGHQIIEVISNMHNKLNRQFQINGGKTVQRKVTDLTSVVVFAPFTLRIVDGDPASRRLDLDTFLSLISPEYGRFVKEYKSILRNRNALIKAIQEGLSNRKELEYWTNKLSILSANIYLKRKEFFEKIKEDINSVAAGIYHDFLSLEIDYLPNFENLDSDPVEKIKNKYLENQEKEIMVGKTLYGVHKDDFQLLLNQKNLRTYGSRGQQRIGGFLLKLAQVNMIENVQKQKPTLLLDDLMSELDDDHRKNLSKFLLDEGFQFILTGADRNEIPKLLKNKSKEIKIV